MTGSTEVALTGSTGSVDSEFVILVGIRSLEVWLLIESSSAYAIPQYADEIDNGIITADEIKMVTKTKQKKRFKSSKFNFSFSVLNKTKPARGNTNNINIGLSTLDNEFITTINWS